MPYELSWYIEGRVTYCRMIGDMPLEEVGAMNDALVELVIQEGKPPVHTILDVTALEKYPTNIKKLSARLHKAPDEYAGWLLVLGASRMVNFVATVAFQLLRIDFRMVSTWDEALATLLKNDGSLPLSPQPDQNPARPA